MAKIVMILVSAGIGLFFWMYLVTYLMYHRVDDRFISRARKALVRGIGVAGVFIIFQYTPVLEDLILTDWFVFPLVFLLLSLPFSWKHIHTAIVLPLLLGGFIAIILYILGDQGYLLWSPFHEEVGKWYQSMTQSYPAAMSPFVSIGFSFLENIRYYSTDLGMTQIIGRTLFSLPLHIFCSLIALWSFFRITPKILGLFLGLVSAVLVHVLYNWSLSFSLGVTIFIILVGYMFYGWSLENGWWKKHLD